MKYLLDTHILLWWYLDHPKLPGHYAELLTTAEAKEEPVGISVISEWEVAKLVSLGKLSISFSLDAWFQELEEDPGVAVLPLDRQIILESVRLGNDFPRDPSDQLIAATARVHGLRLMTLDERIQRSGRVAVA